MDSSIYDEVTFCIIYDTLCWNEDPELLTNYDKELKEYK